MKQIKHHLFFILMLFGIQASLKAQSTGGRVLFNDNWKFHKGDIRTGETGGEQGTRWDSVQLPHDWSIEGPFSDEWASATGYLPGGIGWYKKTFTAPKEWQSKHVFVYFDGVYKNS